MYEQLSRFLDRPSPFSQSTSKTLWTRPHLAQQMLEFHLSQASDLASRRLTLIDQTASWLDQTLTLTGRKLADLGCGPGLYATRFAKRGAEVTGIDFSANSLAYARQQSPSTIRYLEADYLADPLPDGFDVVTLIYTDLCALSPQDRHHLLTRIHGMLNPHGRLVLDVVNTGAFTDRVEATEIEHRMMNGFWSPGDYVGLKRTVLYPDSQLSLDHYLIVEPDAEWEIFNWLQHFDPKTITDELSRAGFEVDTIMGDLAGSAYSADGDLIGLVATRR